ncbi:MAG: hypothetical protein HUU09_06665 [Candidatus Jettenia caeni]|nr:hypothetical protein [Candidatus Jettenia caeni]
MGKGFSVDNLEQMRKFYVFYSAGALISEMLSWKLKQSIYSIYPWWFKHSDLKTKCHIA